MCREIQPLYRHVGFMRIWTMWRGEDCWPLVHGRCDAQLRATRAVRCPSDLLQVRST